MNYHRYTPAAIISAGLDVLVHEVIAASTTLPSRTSAASLTSSGRPKPPLSTGAVNWAEKVSASRFSATLS